MPSEPSQSSALEAHVIGWQDLVFFVVAAAAPLTVMAGVAPLALAFVGPLAPLGYLISGMILLLFAVGFTAMSIYIRNAGAFYSYVSNGLGRPAGAGAAYLATVSYNLMEVGLLAAFGYFAESTIEDLFGLQLAWWTWSVIAAVAIGALGYLRVTFSARVLGIALALEVLVLVVFELAVIADVGLGAFSWSSFDVTRLWGHEGAAGLFVFGIGAFIGFEATAIYAEEVRDRARSVPLATYVAVTFLALFYAFTVWTFVAYFGASDVQSVAAGEDGGLMVFSATETVAGTVVSNAMSLLIVTSAFAATLAFHNVSSRYFFALARDALLPRSLATVSRRHRSPAWAVALQTVIGLVVIAATAIAGCDPYLQVLLWANGPGVVGIMALQILAALAVIVFFARDRRRHSAWRVIIAPGLAAAGLSALLLLVVSNFELLTATTLRNNIILLLPLLLIFCSGVARALHVRRVDPPRYEALSSTSVDDDDLLEVE